MTKTALLDWNKIRKDVKIGYTRKKFYKKFLYRISYSVPGIRVLSWYHLRHSDLDEKVKAWNERITSNHYSWGDHLNLADVNQIKDFYRVFQNKNENTKFRIEGNLFNIYSNSEENLYQLANTDLSAWKQSVVNVTLVESEGAKELLDKGLTLVKFKPEYEFRVRLKEGFPKINERNGLAVYLNNLGNEIRISELIFERLKAHTKYFAGGYVYLNDYRLIDMLRLVAPNIVGTVDQMVNQ